MVCNIRPLGEAYASIAQKELNETPEGIEQGLTLIRHWLERSPHIRARKDAQFLVNFFRGCKFSMERVKEKLDMYYTARSRAFRGMVDFDPLSQKMLTLLRSGIFIPLFLREHSPNTPATVLVKVCYDTDLISQSDLIDFGVMGLELGIDNDIFSVCGVAIILDYQNLNMGHVLQYTPLFIQQIVTLFQTSAPTRIKGFHFVNVAPAFVFIAAILKSLLPEKVRSRVWVHLNPTDLHAHIPKENLPPELGGKGLTVPELIDDFEALVRSKRDLLLDCKNFGIDEWKRPTKRTDVGLGEALEGSFRKITVD